MLSRSPGDPEPRPARDRQTSGRLRRRFRRLDPRLPGFVVVLGHGYDVPKALRLFAEAVFPFFSSLSPSYGFVTMTHPFT
jgi:hypothetical protein